MKTYEYIRGSRDDIDQSNQQFAIKEYCRANSMTVSDTITDTISTKKPMVDRKIHGLLTETAERGDFVIVSEVSRLGRSTLEVLELAKIANTRGICIKIAKQNITFDGTIQSKAYATMLALFAEIERDFLQERTKTALDKRKSLIEKDGFFISTAGKKIRSLGRPKGATSTNKLDKHHNLIADYIAKGLSKSAIAKLLNTTRPTLDKFLNKTQNKKTGD